MILAATCAALPATADEPDPAGGPESAATPAPSDPADPSTPTGSSAPQDPAVDPSPTPEPSPSEPSPDETAGTDAPDTPAADTPAAEPPADLAHIDLLEINDLHAQLEPAPPVPGIAVVAGAVNSIRAQNPNTLLVSAGDNVGTSPFTSLVQDDVPTLDALNAMGVAASAIGNHELFRGRADFDGRVEPLAQFPYLCVNLYDRTTGVSAYQEYSITEVDGVRVGFIGAMTETLYRQVTPTGVASLEVRPIVTEVNRVAAQLSDGDLTNDEADVLVLLVHEGPTTSKLADSTNTSAFGLIARGVSPEVDVIFAGHTHKPHAHLLPVEGWPSTVLRPVVQSGLHGRALAEVTLDVDRTDGEVVATTAQLIALPGSYAPDPGVEAIVAAATAYANERGAVSVGQITGDLRLAALQDGDTNLGAESTMANLVASAHLWATQPAGAQIAFTDPGGVWAELLVASGGPGDPDGNVTYREVVDAQSHDYRLVTMTLTGRQVLDVLEEQWHLPQISRPMTRLGIAGLTYTFDPTRGRLQHITQAWVGSEPLDEAAEYTVVANTFLAAGGNNIATFSKVTERRETGVLDVDALEGYLQAHSPYAPELAQRSVGVHVVSPTGEVVPGGSVTVELSSLGFTRGEPQDADVTVSIAGRSVGTFPVDPTIVDKLDETGRATATFTVPPGTPPGPLVVDLAMPVTGTRASFTLSVAAAPACAVEYDAVRLWGGVMVAGATVTNSGNTPVDGWQLAWDYTQGERALVGVGATVGQSGTRVTARNAPWNGRMDPGSSVTFALVGRAPNGTGTPAGMALNGVPCTVR